MPAGRPSAKTISARAFALPRSAASTPPTIPTTGRTWLQGSLPAVRSRRSGIPQAAQLHGFRALGPCCNGSLREGGTPRLRSLCPPSTGAWTSSGGAVESSNCLFLPEHKDPSEIRTRGETCWPRSVVPADQPARHLFSCRRDGRHAVTRCNSLLGMSGGCATCSGRVKEQVVEFGWHALKGRGGHRATISPLPRPYRACHPGENSPSYSFTGPHPTLPRRESMSPRPMVRSGSVLGGRGRHLAICNAGLIQSELDSQGIDQLRLLSFAGEDQRLLGRGDGVGKAFGLGVGGRERAEDRGLFAAGEFIRAVRPMSRPPRRCAPRRRDWWPAATPCCSATPSRRDGRGATPAGGPRTASCDFAP